MIVDFLAHVIPLLVCDEPGYAGFRESRCSSLAGRRLFPLEHYGSELADRRVSAQPAVDVVRLSKTACGLDWRRSTLADGRLVTRSVSDDAKASRSPRS